MEQELKPFEYELNRVTRLVEMFPGSTSNQMKKEVQKRSYDENFKLGICTSAGSLTWKLRYQELKGKVYSVGNKWYPK